MARTTHGPGHKFHYFATSGKNTSVTASLSGTSGKNPLEEQRKVAWFFTTLREPIGVELADGLVQRVVGADVPEHRATPRGDDLAHHTRYMGRDLPIRRRANVDAIIFGRYFIRIVVNNVECRAHFRREVILFAPCDELADGVADQFRVVPVLERRDARFVEVDDPDPLFLYR